jgi:hypothetical protein
LTVGGRKKIIKNYRGDRIGRKEGRDTGTAGAVCI